MGKVVEKKRKKKKGRPSLLDLQKRSLKLQKQLLKKHNKNLLNSKNNIIINNNKNNNTINNNKNTPRTIPPPPPQSNPGRRSTRRNANPISDKVQNSGRLKEKKLKLVGELPDADNEDGLEDGKVDSGEEVENSGFSDSTPGENGRRNLRKRKIDSISRGSGSAPAAIDDKLQAEKKSIAVKNQANNEQGSNKQIDGPSTPLPDKKLLLFILDSLQKKDTYGVFADPVDQEELPDYHEVIEQPMDFSTVRKKLQDGSYGNLEQFEKDIFLISSNAMQYNEPETIYFRQARSMHELARKNFENLRQDSDDNELELQPKVVRRGRPPTKNLKRPLGRPPLERANSDFSEATLATSGGSTNRLNQHRKGPPHLDKHGSTGSFVRTLCGSRNSEAYGGLAAERFERSDDIIGSATKGYSMKYGKKQILLDESRRNTYQNSYALLCGHEPSVLTTFCWERKQLIAVGLHTEHGYARSLARFAAKLGPIAWNVASKKIEKCLPSGVKFGQGWIGENEAPSRSLTESSDDRSEQTPQKEQLSELNMPVDYLKSNNESDNPISTSPSASPSSVVNRLSSSTGPVGSRSKVQIHQASTIQSSINGISGRL